VSSAAVGSPLSREASVLASTHNRSHARIASVVQIVCSGAEATLCSLSYDQLTAPCIRMRVVYVFLQSYTHTSRALPQPSERAMCGAQMPCCLRHN
jgi:hypothetical protein